MSERKVRAWAVVVDFRNGAIAERIDSALEIYTNEGIAKATCIDGERVVPVTIVREEK